MKSKYALITAAATTALLTTLPAVAEEAAATGMSTGTGLKLIGAGLAIGLAVVGAGQGQGHAAKGALESIGRNPQAYNKIFTPFLLAMALIEFQAILGLIIAFLILGK
ncbi:ATP synthase F0 subunit C [Fluviispira multicolorata]|uniref:ATP synthase subunit c n=1 Tax=Fluviispira multicolorata TaxID=2654512 RepID=A0A833JCU7_9BACT|nr:ATP synthase F0 subunit C [Fluviispira multicolorata]KAB8030933.1 F0F1 ATP synthase subunit C [Fluviispira multicolorata]